MKKLVKSILPSIVTSKYRAYKKRKIYNGDDVFCPICKSSFTVFGPFGLDKRKNARCYHCGSLERHRLVYLYLKDKFNLFHASSKKKVRLLHFAPEKMFYDIFSESDGIEYTPCDLYPEKFQYNGRVEIKKIDITEIPFKENSFDFILCSHVLEHISNDRLAMSEMHRVLTKNGDGILQVPVDYSRKVTYEDDTITAPEERIKHFGQHDHVRVYGKDYKKRLKDSGFKVKEVDYISSLSKTDTYKFGLIESEYIYHCRK